MPNISVQHAVKYQSKGIAPSGLIGSSQIQILYLAVAFNNISVLLPQTLLPKRDIPLSRYKCGCTTSKKGLFLWQKIQYEYLIWIFIWQEQSNLDEHVTRDSYHKFCTILWRTITAVNVSPITIPTIRTSALITSRYVDTCRVRWFTWWAKAFINVYKTETSFNVSITQLRLYPHAMKQNLVTGWDWE